MQTIIGYVVTAALSWAFAKLHTWYAQKQLQAANAKAASDSVQPLKDAKTGEEIDKAANSALSGF